MDKKEFCEFYEQILKAQLTVVRQFAGKTKNQGRRASKGRSQVSIAEDILKNADAPLHVTEIINKAKKNYEAVIDRESLVSALTKKVKKGDRFIRVAPNTFALAAESEK